MKQVCGTCLFGIDNRAEHSRIEVLCAYDNQWHVDRSSGCSKWTELTSGLTKKDIIDLANRSKDEEIKSKRHEDLLKDSKTNRKNQVLLVVLGALLGILGTLVSQYIISLWSK